MKKLTSILIGSALVGVLALTGCGSNDSKVTEGVNEMLATTEDLSQAIKSEDEAKVKEIGPKLEEQWSSFEDDVKKDNEELYEKIEKYLDPTIAGSEAETLESEALTTLNNELTAALEELASTLK